MTLFSGANVDVPPGVILPWNGKGEHAPPGWVYCDGNNGTPDLTDKYVKCVPDTNTNPGLEGGQDSVTISTFMLPAHNHIASFSSDGAHSHTVNPPDNAFEDSSDADDRESYQDYDPNDTDDMLFNSAGDHSHTFNIEDEGLSSPSSFDNHPKRQSVSYIQKL